MRCILIFLGLLSLVGFSQAQQFQAAQSVCEQQQITMDSTQGIFSLFSYEKEIPQQDTAEIGKDLYLLSRNTPFHVLKAPILESETKQLLDIWQDYQRQQIVQNGEKEFFLFFTNAKVGRTHQESSCPAKGSWYALQLYGIKVSNNKPLLKALQAENWKDEIQQVIAKKSNAQYFISLELLCADEYGGENCIFIMKD